MDIKSIKKFCQGEYSRVFAIFFVLPYILFWKMFFAPENIQRFLSNDFIMYFTGFYYTAEKLGQGVFPFWNPHHFQGAPFFARMDLAVLYPFNLLAVLIKNLFSLDVYQSFILLEAYMLFHLTLGGFFVYLLAKEYRVSKFGSFLAGLIFMFSGTALSMLNAVPLITSIIWLPLIHLLYFRYLKGKNAELNYLLTVLIVSVSHFAGYLQHTLLYNGLYLGVLLLFHIFSEAKFSYRRLFTETFKLGLIFFASVLIYAVQFIPAYEFTTLSNRKVIGYDEATLSGTLKPFNIFDFIAPNLMGYIKDGYVINLIPSYLYFGIASLILVIISLFDFKNKGKVFFAMVFFFFFLASMGSFTALYDFIYMAIPGMSKFRNVSKLMYLATLGFSMLAAYGFDQVFYKEKLNLKFFYLPFFSLLGAFFLGGYYYIKTFEIRMGEDSVPDITAFNNSLNTVSLSILFIIISLLIVYHLNNLKNKIIYIILIVLIFIDLGTFNNGIQPNNSSLNPDLLLNGSTKIKEVFNNDKSHYRVHFGYEPAPMHYSPEIFNIYNSDGYSSLIIDSISKQINSRKRDQENFAEELADASVKYVVTNKKLEDKDLELMHNILITKENRDLYYKYGGDGKGMVKKDPGEELNIYQNKLFKGFSNADSETVSYFSNDQINMRIVTSKSETVLKFAYYPGWELTLDGNPTQIESNDKGYIIFKNDPGEHDIELKYVPKSFYLGLSISLVSFLSYLWFLRKALNKIARQ